MTSLSSFYLFTEYPYSHQPMKLQNQAGYYRVAVLDK